MVEQQQSRDEGSILDNAIANVTDPALRATLEREVERLRGSRRFGLVFDRHLPESVRLTNHPIRKGVTVTLRDESTKSLWRVTGFTDNSRKSAVLSNGDERPCADLIVVREFGEPVYPGLKSVERVASGEPDAPWHTVINGENYHVLQALRTTHRRKVDLIYIDPPYNTGNDSWIYNDRYIDANDRSRSSKWLSFIERRLLIARDLLKPSGVIIVAIGDDEHHRLRMLMDQVFGSQNFLADLVWQGGLKNDAAFSGGGLDYMLTYAKDRALIEPTTRWKEQKAGAEAVVESARAAFEATGDAAAATLLHRKWLKENKASLDGVLPLFNTVIAPGRAARVNGDLSSASKSTGFYDIPHPVTGDPVPRPARGWAYAEGRMQQLIAEGRIFFPPKNDAIPQGIAFLDERLDAVPRPSFTRERFLGSRHVEKILGDKRFPNPKDHDVLMRWFRMVAPSDALILDFFGGSGSTTEAVLRLNAEDGGARQSVLVTNNEVGSKQASALRKAGHHPGDPEWEAQGVFEFVTRPRISTVASGKRPDGSTYSGDVPANVEFFELEYLDPGMVRRGREFQAIAPLLWMEAGAEGSRIDEVAEAGWAIASNYGVLFEIDALTSFAAAITAKAKVDESPEAVFVITDSPTEFQHAVERLPAGISTIRLYEDYLTNYTINTDGGTR